MYHVKEKEYRAIEAVEESVLRKMLQTKRSSPRHFLYLETGLVPARHQIHRQVINYLKYIIDQPNTSLIVRVFESMRNHPKKGDWASWTLSLIEKYEINMTLEEIKETKGSIFKNMVKRQMIKFAFKDLVNRQKKGEKGRNIYNTKLSNNNNSANSRNA